MNLLRPIPQPCPNCNTLTQPVLTKNETRTQIVTEAKWCCKNCGAFFQRAPVECIEKIPAVN